MIKWSICKVTFFLTGTDELRIMARRIFDFGGHFFIFHLYFMILSPDEIDVLPMVEPRSFAVSTNLLYFTI